MKKRGKSAQAWVESVVYTLIGLTIIGIVLGIATPKIKQMTDKAIIEQTISAMNELDQKINIIQTATGNSRQIDFLIKKGAIIIDSKEDKIYFKIEGTGLEYSQPGESIRQGGIIVLTEENGKNYDVSLILDYSGSYDVVLDSGDANKVLTQSPTPYSLLVRNPGQGKLEVVVI